MAKRFQWKLRERELMLGERTLLVGVLNVTPDSFSDGGQYDDPDRAYARALELEDEGADILDIGGESTKPGSRRVPEAEELRRVIPVLKKLRDQIQIPISVDTYKAAVAEKALDLGAAIVNDPSGNLWDLQMAKVVAKHDAGFILNHMRGTPETWSSLPPLQNLMRSIAIDLEAAQNRARQSGVQKQSLVIDPGLGFGKRREQNAEIIAELPKLRAFDLPIMVGPSRKSFLKAEDLENAEFATAAAVTAAILNGAHLVRVHDVKRMRKVLQVADEIRLTTELKLEQAEAAPRPAKGGQAAPQQSGPRGPVVGPRPGGLRGNSPKLPHERWQRGQ